MAKLLEDCELACGQVFYLNDGNPTNLFFFLDPLYSMLNPKARQCPSAAHIPPLLTTLTSNIFNVLSRVLGVNFYLPFWGFTYMESYKVSCGVFFLNSYLTHIFFADQRQPLFFYWKSQARTWLPSKSHNRTWLALDIKIFEMQY